MKHKHIMLLCALTALLLTGCASKEEGLSVPSATDSQTSQTDQTSGTSDPEISTDVTGTADENHTSPTITETSEESTEQTEPTAAASQEKPSTAESVSKSVSLTAERPSAIEQLEDTEGFDTLSLTQEEYESLVSDMISGSAAISDMQVIEEICKVHIATSRAYVRDPGSYSTATFFSPESGENQFVINHVSQYEYLTALYKAYGWTIYSDILSFSGFKAEIDGDNAHASIVENYSYDFDNGFDMLSQLSREYSIDLRKSSGNWYITCISTDSLIENSGDLEAQIALLNQTVESAGLSDDPDPAELKLYYSKQHN